jgi:hypothetical protein
MARVCFEITVRDSQHLIAWKTKGVTMGLSIVGATESASQLGRYPQLAPIPHRRQPVLSITTVVRKLSGGSQSCLVQCNDRKLYVLKMHPNPQGPNVLANEALGSMLLRGLGFLAPRWRPVTIDLKTVRFFPDLTMTTEENATVFPTFGIHFGSEYLGGPQYNVYDFMPKSYAHRLRTTTQLLPIYLFDVWASHQDERQFIYQRDRDAPVYDKFFDTFCIDNGHLFGGPNWSHVAGHSRGTCSAYIKPPILGDPRIDQCLSVFEERIPGLLHHAIAAIPAEWHKDDIHMLYARLLWRLEAIRTLVDWELARIGPRGSEARY